MAIAFFSRLLSPTIWAGVFAVMFLAPTTAKADTLTDFTLNATLANGGSESGTLTLDRTTNLFLPGNITVISYGITYTLTLSQQEEDFGTYRVLLTDTSGVFATLNLPAVSTLASYQGGQVASDTFYSGVRSQFVATFPLDAPIDVQSGTFEPVAAPTAVTPEPSSIALLGTAMLGIAGILRKRLA